jgi:hypothetical protein
MLALPSLSSAALPQKVRSALGHTDARELFLLESEQMKMNPERIHGRTDIIFKWKYDEEHDDIAD